MPKLKQHANSLKEWFFKADDKKADFMCKKFLKYFTAIIVILTLDGYLI